MSKKRAPLIAVSIFTFLMTSAGDAAQGNAQEEISLPEVEVKSDAAARQHPQDHNYSDRPLGCVEVVTPGSTGNELGGHFQGRNARDGIPVMPDLNNPTSAADHWRRGPTNEQHVATPPGREGKPGCAR